jgi:hypothetical protein
LNSLLERALGAHPALLDPRPHVPDDDVDGASKPKQGEGIPDGFKRHSFLLEAVGVKGTSKTDFYSSRKTASCQQYKNTKKTGRLACFFIS